jgi:hypothetical protein
MNAKRPHACQIARRLLEAIGYLEMGMVPQSQVCLAAAGRSERFASVTKMIRDEMSRRQSRLAEDAVALEVMQPMAPEPVKHEIVLALTQCYREAGEGDGSLGMPSESRSSPRKRRRGESGKK